MGFAEHIKSRAVSGWKDFYIDYDELISKIKTKEFRPALIAELTKINSFYFLLEKKAVEQKNKLFEEIVEDISNEGFSIIRAKSEKTLDPRKRYGLDDSEINSLKKTAGDNNIGIYMDLEPVKMDNSLKDTVISVRDENDCKFSISSGSEKGKYQKTANKIEFGFGKFIGFSKGFNKRKKEKHMTELVHSLVKIKGYRN